MVHEDEERPKNTGNVERKWRTLNSFHIDFRR